MAICPKCGMQNKDDARFCGVCGTVLNTSTGNQNRQDQQTQQKTNDSSEKTKNMGNSPNQPPHDRKDIDINKNYAIVSYILFLFIVPILFAKDSKFARFHANQGLVLFICEIGISTIFGILTPIFTTILPILGLVFNTISGLFSLLFIALAVIGIINAANGKVKELPVIGSFRII